MEGGATRRQSAGTECGSSLLSVIVATVVELEPFVTVVSTAAIVKPSHISSTAHLTGSGVFFGRSCYQMEKRLAEKDSRPLTPLGIVPRRS